MDATDIIGLISGAVSTVLAVVALWLSVVFFRMSSAEAQRSQRSAEEVSGSVQRLEVIFNAMYTDTFSMMKETVTDMRAHVWRAPIPIDDAEAWVSEKEASERLQADLVNAVAEVRVTSDQE